MTNNQTGGEAATPMIDLAHEIWAAAQLLPAEGIGNGVVRIMNILAANQPTQASPTILPPLPQEVDSVWCMIRGERDQSEACDYYYTAQQMRNYALSAIAGNQPVQAAPAVPSDEQMLRVFNSAESVIDVLHEIRALFTTTANADKESK